MILKIILKILVVLTIYTLTTDDGWSSLAIDSYNTYTDDHFYTNWKLCNATLAIEEIIELHTADHLKEETIKLLDKRSITDKVSAITHYNASNITNAVIHLKNRLNLYSIRCAAHTIQLAIKKGFNENVCNNLIKIASPTVTAFKQSPKQSNSLKLYLQ
jgi:hypothetical protein